MCHDTLFQAKEGLTGRNIKLIHFTIHCSAANAEQAGGLGLISRGFFNGVQDLLSFILTCDLYRGGRLPLSGEVGGQMFHINSFLSAHYKSMLEHMLHLPDITRPIVMSEQVKNGAGKASNIFIKFLIKLCHEMLHQHEHIDNPLS